MVVLKLLSWPEKVTSCTSIYYQNLCMKCLYCIFIHQCTSEKYQNSWSVKYSCDNKIFMMLIELPQVFVIVTLCSMYIGTLDMSKA